MTWTEISRLHERSIGAVRREAVRMRLVDELGRRIDPLPAADPDAVSSAPDSTDPASSSEAHSSADPAPSITARGSTGTAPGTTAHGSTDTAHASATPRSLRNQSSSPPSAAVQASGSP